MAQADLVQPSQMLQNNYPGVTSNGNTREYLFDYNSGTGNYKGAAALTENTDGTLTFWFYDQNFTDNGSVYTEIFQFTWVSPNGSIYAGAGNGVQSCFTVDTGPIPTAAGSYRVDYPFTSIQNFANTIQFQPSFDAVNISTGVSYAGVASGVYTVFRARLYPRGGAGTVIHLANVSHHETAFTYNQLFNDGTPPTSDITLLGPTPPPVTPATLTAVNPGSADRLTTITLTGTNITTTYEPYFGSLSHPGAVTGRSATSLTVIVPASLSVGPTTIFISDGIHQSNSLTFTVTGAVLFSPYASEIGVLFPAPPSAPPPPKLIAVSVAPATMTLTEGQDGYFKATGTYDTGTTIDLTTTSYTTWSVSNVSGVASIDPQSGHIVAQVAGTGVTVTATYSDPKVTLAGQATLQIAQRPIPPSKLVALTITPLAPVVALGNSQQFHAAGQALVYSDVQGQIVSSTQTVYPPLTWSITPITGAGTTNSYGLFTATDIRPKITSSLWQATVPAYPAAGNGPVNRAPDATSIDGPLQYGFGTTLPAAITQSNVYLRAVGYIIPKVSGLYTIGLAYSGGANCYVNGQLLFGDITDTHGAPATSVYTKSGTITLQANTHYPVVVEWASPTTSYGLQLLWTPPGGGIGLIPVTSLEGDQNGGATVNITASAQDGSGLSASTTIEITAPAPPPPPQSKYVSVTISPKTAIVSAGSTQVFTLTGYDQYGIASPITNPTFSVANYSGAGTIDQAGLFTGQIAGTNVIVTAMTPDLILADSAALVVIPGPPTRLALTPPSVTLQIGQGQQFTALGYDAYGNAKVLSGITWSVVGGVGTTTQGGLFSATTSGVGKEAITFGALSGTALVNVLTVIGGVTQITTPQQPFARIHVRKTLADPVVIDTRRAGGGLRDPAVLSINDNFWWDLSTFDGLPFQNYGIFASNIVIPAGPGQSSDPETTATLAQAVFQKYASPAFLGVLTPQTSIPVPLGS